MQLVHWPPEYGLIAALQNGNYQLATRYFELGFSLVLVALVIGLAVLDVLVRFFGNKEKQWLHVEEMIFLSVGAGLALIITEIFFVALAGVFYPVVIEYLLLADVLIALLILISGKRSISSILDKGASIWSVAGSVIFILILLLYQYSSATSFGIDDSTAYHVPYAGIFVKHHGLDVDYHLIYPFQTLNVNLVYALGLLFDSDLSFIQTLHAWFGTLAMLGLYAAVRRFAGHQWLAVLAPFVLAQIYPVRFGGNSANVDLGSMYFVLAAIFPLLLWQERREEKWLLVLSAVCFGMAMGSKYLMCIFALPVAVFIVLQEGRRSLASLLLYGTVAACFGLWWYIRNFWMTGNPVHPFAPEIFGYYLWDDFDMYNQMQNLRNGFLPATFLGFVAAPYFAALSETLRLQHVFYVLLALYCALPFIGLAARPVRFLPLFCLTYIYFWVNGSPDPRYVMPVMPLVVLYVASVCAGLIGKFLPVRHRLVTAFHVSFALLAFAYAGMCSQQKFTNLLYHSILPGEAALLARRYHPEYELVEHANSVFGEEGRVFEFGLRNIRWFFRGELFGTQFGEHGYMRTLKQVENDGAPGYSPQKLEALLKDRYQVDGFMIASPPSFVFDMEAFDRYFELVYRNRAGSLYKFRQVAQ